MPPSTPIQCCVNDWKEKINFSNIDPGGRPTYFKMAKNMKRLIIFARDVAPPASYAPVW
jgi:hypothetical protein